MENENKLCEAEVKKNLVLAEIGKPLTIPLAILNKSCHFQDEWNRIQKVWHHKKVICVICGKEFSVSTGRIKACSPKCSKVRLKAYYKNPEIIARKKAYCKRPKTIARQKAYRERPEIIARRKAYRERPEVIARRKAYRERPEVKARLKARRKVYYKNPEIIARRKAYRERRRERLKSNGKF